MTEPRPVAALTCLKEDEYKEITVELEPKEITREGQEESMLVGQILAEKVLNRGLSKTILRKLGET